MSVRIDHDTVTGVFHLDGERHEVENNIWVFGNDDECVVIDAPHDVDAIRHVIGSRRVVAIVATHAHDDHVRVAPALADAVGAPVLLHPDDLVLWRLVHPVREPEGELIDGQVLRAAGTDLRVLHTPGHAPGAVCLSIPALGVVFTGDTLFSGGPGATGRSFSDRELLERSIRARLFSLPDSTVVHPGHGASTTIGAERERGWVTEAS